MSIANIKGGFYKTLEVNRDDSNVSETILTDAMLTKTNNYIVQVQNFVNSNTQPLNTLDEALFTIKPRGTDTQAPETVVALPVGISIFQPSSYFSILELSRQLDKFCERFTESQNFANDNGLEFTLNQDGTFLFKLYPEFSTNFYIELSEAAQKLTGFRQYIFVINDGVEDIGNVTDTSHLDLLDPYNFFTYDNTDATYDVEEEHEFPSLRPLTAFDWRLSLDVIATFPISTKPSIVDSKETNDYVLARFPSNDYQHIQTQLETFDDEILSTTTLIEKVNIGLENMTRNNTEAISNFMLNGKIQHINLKLETRYFFDGKIIRVPTNVKHGFFSLKLLFSKRQT